MCPYVPFVRALFFSKIWWIRRKNTISIPYLRLTSTERKRWRCYEKTLKRKALHLTSCQNAEKVRCTLDY